MVLPPRKSDPKLWSRWLPCPESFHPEHEVWRQRSVLDQGMPELTPKAVDAFVQQGLAEGEVGEKLSEELRGNEGF